MSTVTQVGHAKQIVLCIVLLAPAQVSAAHVLQVMNWLTTLVQHVQVESITTAVA